jgi:beta-lactamase class D
MRILGWLAVAGMALAAQDVTFVTMTPKGVAKVVEGSPWARRRVSPCSTFKIPNSVIGLETGAIPSADYVIRYEEKKHRTPGFWIDAWSKDLDLRGAFRASAVWYFRELAARVGQANMKAFVDRLGYGNRDMSAWPESFWIGSTLRISPVEQVEFLDRLFRNQMGLTPGTVAAVESFMKQEAKDGRELFYKTGACTDREAGPVVWLVGFVQAPAGRTYFAFNASGAALDALMAKRVELARERLERAGLWR